MWHLKGPGTWGCEFLFLLYAYGRFVYGHWWSDVCRSSNDRSINVDYRFSEYECRELPGAYTIKKAMWVSFFYSRFFFLFCFTFTFFSFGVDTQFSLCYILILFAFVVCRLLSFLWHTLITPPVTSISVSRRVATTEYSENGGCCEWNIQKAS